MSAVAVASIKPVASADAGHLQTTLQELGRRLEGPRAAIEQAFLEMGQQLLDSIRFLNELSSAHESMPAELESGDFNTAAGALSAIRDEIARMASTHLGEGDHFGQLGMMAMAASSPLQDLRRSVRTIRLVAVNARIAAASIDGSKGELGAFTTDMMELGHNVESAVASFAKAHEAFVRVLHDARRVNAAFATRHGGTMEGISARLTEHLGKIDTHRQRAGEQAREHGQLTNQIRNRVGLAVSALQVGDITRQRVEHVEAALAMTGQGDAIDATRHDGTISFICRLAAGQLNETLCELDEQMSDLARTLTELAGDAAQVVAAGNREAEATLTDGDTALGAMIDDLGLIRALFSDFAQTRAATEAMAKEVARAVTMMTDHLDAIAEIEQRIRLLSLNTAIQCGRFGDEGRALRVIAQDLRDIASETVAASDAILASLDGAGELARQLVEGESSDLARRIVSLEANAGQAIDLFGAVSERLRQSMNTMIGIGPRAVSQLEAALGQVSRHRDLGAPWQAVRDELPDLAPLQPDAVDADAIDAAALSALRARYTMDSERRLHDTMAAGIAGLADAAGEANTTSSDDAEATAHADLDGLFL